MATLYRVSPIILNENTRWRAGVPESVPTGDNIVPGEVFPGIPNRYPFGPRTVWRRTEGATLSFVLQSHLSYFVIMIVFAHTLILLAKTGSRRTN